MKIKNLIKGLEILDKHQGKLYGVHNAIHIFGLSSPLSDDDKKILVESNWHFDLKSDAWINFI